MKLQLVSDLHLDEVLSPLDYLHNEVLPQIAPVEHVDALVIAGDFFSQKTNQETEYNLIRLLLKKYTKVVMVLGNHDYWGAKTVPETQEYYARLSRLFWNFYPLINERITIRGVEIAGATTWFSCNSNTLNNIPKGVHVSDLRQIDKYKRGRSKRRVIKEQNAAALEFFEWVSSPVWVSHHAPSFQAMSPHKAAEPRAIYDVCTELGELIEKKKPVVHLHGHVHENSTYKIGDTPVYCNPRGNIKYNGGHNPNFNNHLILDL